MLLVQRDDMVEDLEGATSDPAFRNSILPGRLDACLLVLQTRRFQESDDIGVIRVAAEDDVSIRGSFGKRFAQWLDNPLGGRVLRYVAVQDLASPMFDHEEAVESLNVTVGTVKKSNATITSRWFWRKANHRLPGSPRRPIRRRYRATLLSETTKPSF
jgi:hypothetical protein